MQDDTRLKTIRFRVSVREYADIVKQIPPSKSFSDFARETLSSENFQTKKEKKTISHQIARIGNNLNQIAYTLNYANLAQKRIDTICILKELQCIREELINIIK